MAVRWRAVFVFHRAKEETPRGIAGSLLTRLLDGTRVQGCWGFGPVPLHQQSDKAHGRSWFMRRTAKIAMLSCGDFQEPKNVGRQEGVARRPKIGTEISNKRVRFYLNRKLEERIKFRCQVARPPRGLNSDPVDIVPQPVPFARIEHRKNSKAAKKALQVCGGLRLNPEQDTRSGSYKSLPQLVRSPGGVWGSGDGDTVRIAPIKSKVGSETAAHNAAAHNAATGMTLRDHKKSIRHPPRLGRV